MNKRTLSPVNRLFDSLLSDYRGYTFPNFSDNSEIIKLYGSYPKIDIIETKESRKVIADVPGYSKEDIKVIVETDKNSEIWIKISGEKEDKNFEKSTYYYKERGNSCKFTRGFTVDNSIDVSKISATVENSQLIIDLPFKKIKEEKAKVIDIK